MSAITLRVATYNVHDCIGRDGVYAPDRIAAIVADLDADIVALQEVTLDHVGDVLAMLEQTTGMQAIDGTLLERRAGRYGNVLLARWPAADPRLHDLSFPGREPRGVVDTRIVVRGRTWRVMATHLGLAWRERREQLSYLAGELSADGPPAVIMGDFNNWLGAWAFAPLTRLGLVHCRVTTFPTWPLPLLSLDRILVKPPAHVVRCARVVSTVARIASDHFPVVADLREG